MPRALFFLALLVLGVFGDFAFPSFGPSDNSKLSYVSDTFINNTDLILTRPLPSKAGAVWYVGNVFDPIGEYVLPGFKTEFTFVVDSIYQDGGDGIAFVFQSGSPYLVGTIGAGIGYGDYQNKLQGIPDSVAIEFDTIQDSEMNDPNDNHCGVHSEAESPNSSNEDAVILGLRNTTIPLIQNSGVEHLVVVEYVAKDTSLTIEYDGELILSSTSFNLTDYIQTNDGNCFIGLTASTTVTSFARHYVKSWYFYSGNGTIDIPATIVYGPGLQGAAVSQPAEFYLQLVDIYGYNATASGASQGIFPACNVTAANDPSTPVAECVMNDNLDGTYTATYETDNLGQSDIYVTVNEELVGASPYTIFITGPPSAQNCVATGSGISTATAGELTTFTISTADAIGTPIQTGGAVFQSWVQGPQTMNVTITDNGDGTYGAVYNVTITGDYSLNVLLVGADSTNAIRNSPFDVTCVPNVINPATSIAYGEGLTSSGAGETATFYIQGRDSWNNNATSPNINWSVTFADDGDEFESGPTQTLVSPGLYQITYEIDDEGDFTLIVQGNGVSVIGSPFDLTVTAGPPYAGDSELVTDIPATVSTQVPLTINILAEDEFGNSITVGGAFFNCSFSGEDNFVVAATDNNDGTYTCSYSYSLPGDYTIDIFLVGGGANTGPIEDNPFSQLAVGPAYGPECDASGSGLRSATAGAMASFEVDMYDRAGTAATSGDDTCTVVLTGPATVTGTCVYSGQDNVYDASYTLTTAGSYILNVTVNGDQIKKSPFNVNCGPALYSPGYTVAVGEGLTQDFAGEIANFTLTLFDQYGNQYPGTPDIASKFNVTLTKNGKVVSGDVDFQPATKDYFATYELENPTGTWRLDVTLDGTAIEDSPFSPVLYSGAADPQSCFVFPTYNQLYLANATAYVADFFDIQAVDNYGNNVTNPGETFIATFSLIDDSSSSMATTKSFQSSYVSDGLYVVDFTLDEAGEYTVDVTDLSVTIQNGNLFIYVDPALPVANQTTAEGSGLQTAVAGVFADFTIVTRDIVGEPVTRGGETFTITMVLSEDDGDDVSVDVSYQDNNDGTYSCSYNATVAGDYRLTITMDGQGQIKDSPDFPEVIAGKNCPQFATVFGPNLATAETNTTSYFTIQSVDCYGNPVTNALVYYDVLIDGPDCTFADVEYVGNGQSNVTYIVMEPGNYSIIIEQQGNQVKGSPFPLTVTGGEQDESSSSLSSSSLAFLICMIIFIILFVITCLVLIAYVLYDKKKKIKKFLKKQNIIDSSSSSDDD